MKDSDAIARLKQGDIGGLEALVRRYQVRAVDAAFLICHDQAASEDIVQDAFIRAYERIEQFDSSRNFGPWFLRIVINDTLKHVTRGKSISLEAQSVEVLEIPNSDPSLESLLENAETREAIWETLEKLSPRQRAAIVMRYYLEMSDNEVSVALKVPPGTVRRRLHEARRSLRNLLPAWVRQPAEE